MKFEVKKRSFVCMLLLVFVIGFSSFGQNFTEVTLKEKLDSMSLKSAGLNNTVQVSISNISLFEFVYSLGYENNLNVIIDPAVNQSISYNFFDAKVKDVLVFLYLNFELEYEFTGSIISVKKRLISKPIVQSIPLKQIDVQYNAANEFLSMNLVNDTLWKVLEKVTVLIDKNFVISPSIRNKQVNAFFQNRPYEQVLDMFVKANGLALTKEKDNFYTIGPAEAPSTQNNTSQSGGYKKKENSADFTITKNNDGKLDVFANNIDLLDIVKAGTAELNSHYVLHSNVDGKANLNLKNVTLDELINNLFQTTRFNYSFNDGVYVIGERKMEGIRKTELIRMENRSVEKIKEAIPADLLIDMDLSYFLDLNGLIVTGSDIGISKLKKFLKEIDIVVPMIQIDVIFLYSASGTSKEGGIKAGIKDKPTITTGGVDENGINGILGASAINNLLTALNGFGTLNLGKVTENFYLSLKALERDNVINTESTPKISTLNGQTGTISIGETKYFQQQQINVISSVQQAGVQTTNDWTPTEASLSVSIVPFVSADEQITITIKVKNSELGEQKDPKAPPNKTDQSFESIVRVKNGEVILLGGLEKKLNSKSGSGIPFLSRIPVIKWLFSNRIAEKSKSKLHILIKPTVIY